MLRVLFFSSLGMEWGLFEHCLLSHEDSFLHLHFSLRLELKCGAAVVKTTPPTKFVLVCTLTISSLPYPLYVALSLVDTHVHSFRLPPHSRSHYDDFFYSLRSSSRPLLPSGVCLCSCFRFHFASLHFYLFVFTVRRFSLGFVGLLFLWTFRYISYFFSGALSAVVSIACGLRQPSLPTITTACAIIASEEILNSFAFLFCFD